MLASGTSCSDDNTNFDPIGDELGIPYKDGHDVYGVEVWEETSVILTNYYSLIEEIIQEKTAKIQSIWWLSPAKESVMSVGTVRLLLWGKQIIHPHI